MMGEIDAFIQMKHTIFGQSHLSIYSLTLLIYFKICIINEKYTINLQKLPRLSFMFLPPSKIEEKWKKRRYSE